MSIHFLGIRHHGPGSARNVKQFLESVKPDIILVEGPPEADGILQWVTHAELKPPVAILAYQPDNPQQSSFYPFAEFSPEWQAISYARKNQIHVRFMDLPIANREWTAHNGATQQPSPNDDSSASEGNDASVSNGGPVLNDASESKDAPDANDPSDTERSSVANDVAGETAVDPMSNFAAAVGFTGGEKWWEHTFEYRSSNEEVFEAVAETMTELRSAFPGNSEQLEEKRREAYMRKIIRQAEKEMFHTIAVICGAWHVPALINMPAQKLDNELLKGLPKAKIECTWVPWTYSRLSYFSGYGAGIGSPGWYEHIWKYPKDDGTRWMARVAKLFRKQGMDISVAHVIEGVRLSRTLAALRGLSRPGLEELNEAVWSALCNGESILLDLIRKELIVSDKIGEVPADIPKPPLQLDIEKQQKKLRLPATADFKDYTLDLRKETDLDRSIFLHRLVLLNIKWGYQSTISGKGTFKEQWRLQWDPAFSIDIIEKGSLGNTVEEAATRFITRSAEEAAMLSEVCALLESSLPAELPAAVDALIGKINNLAAASGDVIQLMEAVPPLVNVSRYGNVRRTDAELVSGIVLSMMVRVCVSLPAACTAVDEKAAGHLLELFFRMNEAVGLLQSADMSAQWEQTLSVISTGQQTSPVIAGYALRLQADHKLVEGEELIRRFHYAMSSASVPAAAAAWLEGFLKGSGTILLIDEDLWGLVHGWVSSLPEEQFVHVLPLLRRTFSHFTQPERRKLGEKVKSGGGATTTHAASAGPSFNEEQAAAGVPAVLRLLGLKTDLNMALNRSLDQRETLSTDKVDKA